MAQPLPDRLDLLSRLRNQLDESELDLRPAAAQDRDFEVGLTGESFSGLPDSVMSPEQRARMVEHQFEMQQHAYRSQFPDSLRVIATQGEQPVARLWLNLATSELRILDIAVAHASQKQGIGSQLVTAVREVAMGSAVPVRLSVAAGNGPAMRLYLRSGFAQSANNGAMVEMEACP